MQIIAQLIQQLAPYGHYAHIGMFCILIACGFGLPLPEDIILVTGGVLASQGIVDFWHTNFLCMLGVLFGDSVIFSLGWHFGNRVKQFYLVRSIITPSREQMIQKWYKNHGHKVIFFARFAPGLRTPLFLSAGIYRVSPWAFISLDGFAATISVPLWIYVGYLFGQNMELLEKKIHEFQMGLYIVLGLALLVIFLIFFFKKKFTDYLEREN